MWWNRRQRERRLKVRLLFAVLGAAWIGFFAGWNLQAPGDDGTVALNCEIKEAPSDEIHP